MSHYYLTGWVGSGTDVDPMRPDLTAAVWTAVDLRPDTKVTTGWCVVWTQDPATVVPAGATYLGDGSFAQIPNNIRNKLRNQLGLTELVGLTVPEILAELLTVHGGAPGRWGKLRPVRKQTAFGEVDHYEIHLGGKIREWDEAVTP